MGNFKSLLKAECRLGGPRHAPNDSCPGPCISQSSWQYNKDVTTLTYRRGQHLEVSWARNNHHGGFVRFAIVPEHLRMSHEAHSRLAFHYSCFDSGAHNCSLDACGGDRKSIAFRAVIQIPTIYADGFRGVLAWSWFGGLTHSESYFGDYWSCRNIRIEGGQPLSASYPITFKPDAGHAEYSFPALGNNSCLSSVNDVHICTREPCRGRKGTFMKPAPFSGTENPRPVSAAELHMTSASPTESFTPSPSLTVSPTTSPPISGSQTSIRGPTVAPSQTVRLPSTPTITPVVSTPPSPTRTPAFSIPAYPTLSSSPSLLQAPRKLTLDVLVSKVRLVDIDNMKVIEDRFNRTTAIPRAAMKMTFIAETVGRAAFVQFALNDKLLRTELHEPYTAFGDKNGVFNYWIAPVYDSWLKLNVSATSPNGAINYKVYWVYLARQ